MWASLNAQCPNTAVAVQPEATIPTTKLAAATRDPHYVADKLQDLTTHSTQRQA